MTVEIIRGSSAEMVAETPWDLTPYTVAAEIKDQDGTLRGSFTVVKLGQNLQLSLTPVQTLALPESNDLAFDIRFESGGKVTHTEPVYLSVQTALTGVD